MKVYEILEILNDFAPPSLAYEWDNVGLLCGDAQKEIKKAMVTLDTDYKIVREARENGCELILSHHPILFSGIKKIDYTSPDGLLIRELVESGIALIAAHTNMDTAERGINYELAKRLGLKNTRILEQHTQDPCCGLGRVGELEHIITLDEFARTVKTVLDTPYVRVCGDSGKKLLTAAVASGSCSEVIPTARAMGCDVIVTGDMKYHESIDAVNSGIAIIDAGHYPTEKLVTEIFKSIIEPQGIEVYVSKNPDIFRFV